MTLPHFAGVEFDAFNGSYCFHKGQTIQRGTRKAKVAAWWDWAADIIPAIGGKGAGIGRGPGYYHLEESSALAFVFPMDCCKGPRSKVCFSAK